MTAEMIVCRTGSGRSVGEDVAMAVTMWIAAVESEPRAERAVVVRDAVGVAVGV